MAESMSDDDMAEAAITLHQMFVAYVGAGFSENQALKLVAMHLAAQGMTDGMPESI